MLLPRILAPMRALSQNSLVVGKSPSHVYDALRFANGCSAASTTLSFVRHATHQAQGRANGAKDGPGKRLGAKKAGGEYVIPGNIIFRQRGTSWFPGENCKFGRDHCIFATESGYVRYYRDPSKHPDRQYIGVVLNKTDNLPYPPHAARRRRLHYLPVAIEPEKQLVDGPGSKIRPQKAKINRIAGGKAKDYSHRMANWEIGRAAEKANIKVKKFVPGDRWTAWRKSQARIKAVLEKKRLRNAGKKVAKPKPKRK